MPRSGKLCSLGQILTFLMPPFFVCKMGVKKPAGQVLSDGTG